MTPAVGMRFGRYELLQKLGAGGMGEVFRARDHDLGRNVAVKFLPERFAADPDRLGRLTREARTASQLNHPNIVTIHEIGETEGLRFIVMELVEGRTLRDLLGDGPLGTRRILDVAVQIADGLAKAHAANIVHRDLKPENLMVTGDGIVKILDFGLAKLRAPQSGSGPQPVGDDASTRAVLPLSASSSEGFVVGTVGYMSPEQAAGRAVDYRSDQFALGAILYEMASGRRAFKRDTPVQTLSAIIEAEPEPLAALSPSFPPQAQQLVERCLSKAPADRYVSTADLARDLRDIRERLSEGGSDHHVQPRPVPRRRWWVTALGILAVATGVLFTVPSLREGILGPLQLLPLPAERRIAVLPFRATSGGDDQPLCDGLFEFVIARLGQLERFQQAAWVVPAVEVRQSGVATVDGARRALGATVVVTGSLQRTPAGLVVTASVIDATTLRQLRATTFEVGQASLLERTVNAVVEMLDLELGPDARATLQAGGTGVVEASTLYAQARGYAPYSQARTALQRYEQKRNLERAIELFNQALERDPQYALAHAGLGEAYWRLSRFTKSAEQVLLAEQHCRRALEIDPLVAQAWITMGIIHAGTGRADEALQDLQRALERDPRNPDAHRELANAYVRLRRQEDADATYRKAIELRPDNWVNYSYYGSYLYNRGRAAEAEAAYKKAVELVPDNARVWSGLGAAYYFQEKTADAVKAWTRSLELFPNSTAASNLGAYQFFEGQYAEAARTFEQALQIDDHDYRVWRNLAAARLQVPGEQSRAREAYARAAELAEQERELDPLTALTHADLADCYANLGEPAKARAAALEAARLGSDQSDVARLLGEAYEQLGDRTSALEWLRRALDLGHPMSEIERAPGLAKLRSDPRYQGLVEREKAAQKGAGRQPGGRTSWKPAEQSRQVERAASTSSAQEQATRSSRATT